MRALRAAVPVGRVTPSGPSCANGSLSRQALEKSPISSPPWDRLPQSFPNHWMAVGCLNIILVPACFTPPPTCSLPQQGKWDTLWGSLPLLGYPGPSSPEPPGRGCMPLAPCHPQPTCPWMLPAIQAGLLDHSPAVPPSPLPSWLAWDFLSGN